MKPQTLLLAVLSALAPVGLAAQESLVHATIDSGALVRMHQASGVLVQGRLVQPLSPSSTFIRFCHYPAPVCTNPSDTSAIHSISTASLTGLEVQHGNKWASGALWGGLIGVAAGGLLGALVNGLCDGDSGNGDCGPSTGAYAAIGAIGFGAIGGFIGGGKPKWGPAP